MIFDKLKLDLDEEIKLITRQSTIPVYIKSFPFFLAILLWFIFIFPLFRLGLFGVMIFFIVLAFFLYFICQNILKWFNSILVVTNKRAIYNCQQGFFKTNNYVIPLDKIVSYSASSKGFFQYVFKYGKIILVDMQSLQLEIENIGRSDIFLQQLDSIISSSKKINNDILPNQFEPDEKQPIEGQNFNFKKIDHCEKKIEEFPDDLKSYFKRDD